MRTVRPPLAILKLQQLRLCATTCYELSLQHEVSENMNEKSVTRVRCDTVAHAHSAVLFTPPPPSLTWRPKCANLSIMT